MDKSLIQIKAQMNRMERSMLNNNFNPKDPKRFKKWCRLADAIDSRLLAYFGVEHLWENPVYGRENEPLPYEVRIVH